MEAGRRDGDLVGFRGRNNSAKDFVDRAMREDFSTPKFTSGRLPANAEYSDRLQARKIPAWPKSAVSFSSPVTGSYLARMDYAFP
jgi:hypothetical protein